MYPQRVILGVQKKMHLPSAADFCDLIRQAGRGCCLYAIDVPRAYHQLPLDLADWPLICFCFEGRLYIDVSLPFGLRWAASHCQDVTNIVSRELRGRSLSLFNSIDDFGSVASSWSTADSQFFPTPKSLGQARSSGSSIATSLPHPPRSWCGWGSGLTLSQ